MALSNRKPKYWWLTQKRDLFFSQENQRTAVTGVNYFIKDPDGFCFLFVFLFYYISRCLHSCHFIVQVDCHSSKHHIHVKKKKKERKIQNIYKVLHLFLLFQEMFAFISLVRTVTFKGKRGSESE